MTQARMHGVDHVERLRPLVGEVPVLPALMYFNGERLPPTSERYRKTSTGDLLVPAGQHAEAFSALFAGTPLQIGLRDDFITFAWRKFLTNIAVDPLTTLTLQRQAVLRRPDVREVCFRLLEEGVAVGRAAGANLGSDDVARAYETLMTFPPEAGTSMYFDRLAGRPLELEAMTGSLVAIGARVGVATPLNSALLALLRAISEEATSRWSGRCHRRSN
jgi:2-dehydropantoate 2-reductase